MTAVQTQGVPTTKATDDDVSRLAELAGIAPEYAAMIVEEVAGDVESCRVDEVDEHRALLEKFARINARYEAEETRVKDQLKAYLSEINAKRLRLWSVLGPGAEAVAKQLLAGQKTKSIKLAFGTAGFRTTPQKFEVEDEAAVIAWAEEKGFFEMVKIKKELSKSAMNEAIKNADGGTGGELPPSVKLVPAHEKFYLK